MNAPKILVTGASGLVGEAVVFRLLLDRKFIPIAAARGVTRLNGLCTVVPFELTGLKALPSLNGVQAVVHAAARVHVMNETSTDALTEFRKVNVEGTLRLARCAAESGVKRFIFISSIKVNGESTVLGKPFKADDLPLPADPYGVSKYEAEEELKRLSLDTGMEVVIIRPPLVYGPGVKANFLSMMRWLERGVPLPLGALNNRRSLVALDNVVDLINVCISHPEAAGNTFLVSDGEDLSTTQLLRRMAIALCVRAWLIPVPASVLSLGAMLLGKGAMAQRLCGTLQVDIGKTCGVLGWAPPVSVDNALRATARYFKARE